MGQLLAQLFILTIRLCYEECCLSVFQIPWGPGRMTYHPSASSSPLASTSTSYQHNHQWKPCYPSSTVCPLKCHEPFPPSKCVEPCPPHPCPPVYGPPPLSQQKCSPWATMPTRKSLESIQVQVTDQISSGFWNKKIQALPLSSLQAMVVDCIFLNLPPGLTADREKAWFLRLTPCYWKKGSRIITWSLFVMFLSVIWVVISTLWALSVSIPLFLQ